MKYARQLGCKINKFIWPLLFLAATETSGANWVMTESIQEGNFYIDSDSIVDNGQFKIAWILHDLSKKTIGYDGENIRSFKYLQKFDCLEKKFKTIAIISHSKKMGMGLGTNHDDSDAVWRLMLPETPLETVFRFIC